MPLGIVSDEDFESELRKIDSPESTQITGTIEQLPSKGRSNGDVNVPDGLRKIIGEESVINGRAAAIQLAARYGISESSVSAYANGATSTASYDRPTDIKDHIDESKNRVITRARSKMMMAMRHITNEKLEGAKLSTLASVARDMAAVVKTFTPDEGEGERDRVKAPQFVIYAPTIRKEEHYEVVHVKDDI